MRARPTAVAAAATLLAGAGLRLASPGAFEQARAGLLALTAAAAAATLALAWSRQYRAAGAALLTAAAALGLARTPAPLAASPHQEAPVGLTATLRAWEPSRQGWLRVELRLDAADARSWGCDSRLRAEARWEGASPPRVGDRVRAEGLWGGLPARPWLSLARLLPTGEHRSLPLAALRQALRSRLSERLAPERAGVARALLLGDWGGLPPGLRESYRRLGLLHLLAVSGLHFWLWDALLRRTPILRRAAWRWPVLTALGALAGAGPAVARALIALLAREAAANCGRRSPGLSLWAAALLAECAFGAPARQGLGFVLSYAATGCLLLAPPRERDGSAVRALHAGCAASCGSLPVLHALRGTLEPWSPVASPLAALSLPPRLLLSALALVPGCSRPADAVLAGLQSAESRVIEALDRLPGTPWVRTDLPAWRVALAAAAGLTALRARGRGARPVTVAAAAAAAAGLLAMAGPPAPAGLLLLPVGHGLGAVANSGDGTLLFDLGSRGRDPAALLDRVAIPELARRGWRAPRVALLSHGDADHAAGLRLWTERGGLRRLAVGPGEELRLDGFRPHAFRVLGTEPAVEGVSNAGGPVLELRFALSAGGTARAVVLGDQFGGALRALRRRLEPGPIAVLVLPHHGLTTDGLGELLDHLRPREAWVSCGDEDLPLPAAALCARRGIPLRRTGADPLAWTPGAE